MRCSDSNKEEKCGADRIAGVRRVRLYAAGRRRGCVAREASRSEAGVCARAEIVRSA